MNLLSVPLGIASQRGLTWLLGGVRRRDTRLLLAGAALLMFRWYRSRSHARELAYSGYLADGDRITVAYRLEP